MAKEPKNIGVDYSSYVVRRHVEDYWRAEEKVELILSGMTGKISVTTLCKLITDAVLKLETAIANVSLDTEDMQDVLKLQHLTARKDLAPLAPDFSWDVYFKSLGVSTATLNVTSLDFVKGLDQILAATDLDTIKIYLRWHLVHTGVQAQPPRWKTCTRLVQDSMTDALGQA